MLLHDKDKLVCLRRLRIVFGLGSFPEVAFGDVTLEARLAASLVPRVGQGSGAARCGS
jgi:hypothetical protein